LALALLVARLVVERLAAEPLAVEALADEAFAVVRFAPLERAELVDFDPVARELADRERRAPPPELDLDDPLPLAPPLLACGIAPPKVRTLGPVHPIYPRAQVLHGSAICASG
jgi:hypothetical protein